MELLPVPAALVVLEPAGIQHDRKTLVFRSVAVAVVLQVVDHLVLADVHHLAVAVVLRHLVPLERFAHQNQAALGIRADVRNGPILVKSGAQSVQFARHRVDVPHALQLVRCIIDVDDVPIVAGRLHHSVQRSAVVIDAIVGGSAIHVLFLAKTVAFAILVVALVRDPPALLLMTISVNVVLPELSSESELSSGEHIAIPLDRVVHIRALQKDCAILIKKNGIPVFHPIFKAARHAILGMRVLEVDSPFPLKRGCLCCDVHIIYQVSLQIPSEIVYRPDRLVSS